MRLSWTLSADQGEICEKVVTSDFRESVTLLSTCPGGTCALRAACTAQVEAPRRQQCASPGRACVHRLTQAHGCGWSVHRCLRKRTHGAGQMGGRARQLLGAPGHRTCCSSAGEEASRKSCVSELSEGRPACVEGSRCARAGGVRASRAVGAKSSTGPGGKGSRPRRPLTASTSAPTPPPASSSSSCSSSSFSFSSCSFFLIFLLFPPPPKQQIHRELKSLQRERPLTLRGATTTLRTRGPAAPTEPTAQPTVCATPQGRGCPRSVGGSVCLKQAALKERVECYCAAGPGEVHSLIIFPVLCCLLEIFHNLKFFKLKI